MEHLRNYTLERINILSKITKFGKSEFVELRNLVCSRITLFNARRGGEPSRLKVSQWLNRRQWVDDAVISSLDENERRLFKEMELVYGTGKGNHLVSCIIPKDCVAAIECLVSPTIRETAGVLNENDFIFPSTSSTYHSGGWDSTNYVCQQAKISCSAINATNQRVRISTIYAALDVPQHERDYFYSHMGHSAQVNAGTYQRPLAVAAVTKVGNHLANIDRGGQAALGVLLYYILLFCTCTYTVILPIVFDFRRSFL
jgi:hypothetical protein